MIEKGPIEIMKVNTMSKHDYVLEPKVEWIYEDRKRANLNNMVKNILFKILNKAMFNKIKSCNCKGDLGYDHIDL